MSNVDFSKIGEWLRHNQADIAIVIGFILVTVIAFGAGRLSAPPVVKNPVVIEDSTASPAINLLGNVSQPISNSVGQVTGISPVSQQGMFIASKGGTKYHWPWCSYGEKIKETNKIWFNSEAEAQQAGYSPCACIASKAPAGYQSK